MEEELRAPSASRYGSPGQSARKKEAGISPMRRAKANSASQRDFFSERTSATTRLRQTLWIATSGCLAAHQTAPKTRTTSSQSQEGSYGFVLSGELPQGFLRFPYVIQGEFARLNQMRHDRLRAAPKQTQQFVDQSALRRPARDD